MRRGFRASLAALGLSLLIAIGAVEVNAAGPKPIPYPGQGNRAEDCVPDTRLAGTHRVRVVIRCGVQEGKVEFSIRRRDGSPPLGFSARARAAGPGAMAAFRCHRRGPTKVLCRGRKRGPMTVRAWLELPTRERCELAPQVFTPRLILGGKPDGCRRQVRERVASYKEIASFRREYGLDLDLAGNPAAIRARIVALLRAWRRGDPTARATMSIYFTPMRPKTSESSRPARATSNSSAK
jgi:hypothetical protein